MLPLLMYIGACSKSDPEEPEVYYEVEELPVISDENGWDLPYNDGIKNAILNAYQLVDIKYRTKADYNVVNVTYPAGTNVQGIVYSSSRAEDLLVPNNVSLWTYMSALQSPNSYAYTIDISAPPYNIRGTAKPFYGQVCSSLVQYAFGIKHNFQIHQMTVWDGFDKVIPQDIDRLRLGDVLTTERGHTRLVTGIRRDNGHVVEVEITEGKSPKALRRVYPVKTVTDTFHDEDYAFYRYRYINSTKYTPTPFVSADGKSPSDYKGLFVEEVVPRRGDKANWRKDESVILDVVNRKSFTQYKLYKDGQLVGTKDIPGNDVIDLGIMPYGDYKLCLTDGTEDTGFVYWIVADYSISAEAIKKGKGKVKVSFSSKNATPIWTTWRIPANSDSNYNDGPLWTTVITDSDCLAGSVMTQMDSYLVKKFGLGKWTFKVAFETPYGIIMSDSVTLNVK